MTKVNFKISVIALAIGMFAVSCNNGGSKQQSTAETPEMKTEQTKPKVEGLFGAFGLTDEDITPKGSTLALEEAYTKIVDSHIMATAQFPNWDDAAGKAAYPGYINDLMKAIAKADDYGKPSIDDGSGTLRPKTYNEMVDGGLLPAQANADGTKWECHFTYSGKSVRFTVSLRGGATYQIQAYFTK